MNISRGGRRGLALAATAALMLSGGALSASADGIVADGDQLLANGLQSTMNFGLVCPGDSVTKDGTIWLQRTQPNNNTNWWNNAAVVSVGVTANSDSAQLTPAAVSPITLPDNWVSLPTFVSPTSTPDSFRTGAFSMDLDVDPAATPGTKTATVTYQASGARYVANPSGTPLTRDDELLVSWTVDTVANCPSNTAPSTPGTPTASASPTQGGFQLAWTASTDAESDAFTYTLEGKDADDIGFGVVASGLASNSYDFAAGAPPEGTWIYRVKAIETSTSPPLSSGYSLVSSAVVVDRTAPNPPTAMADRAAEYLTWWKDTVTVTFTANGDPALPDTSAGSGVATVTSPQTFTANGPFTASGTAVDYAANESAATELSGNVDANAPVVTLVCPTAPVVQDSTASATWTASDDGSGVSGPTSGSVPLTTTSIGAQTATVAAGAATDNVGHPSAAATCSYNVIYGFDGFFQPIDMNGVWNKVKAGSAIPIKFSLNGDRGMEVLSANAPNPKFTFGVCPTGAPVDAVEQTVTAGSSSLSYDPLADQYVYVWKTDKAWAGKCGTLSVTLADGTSHIALFSLTK